MPKKTRRNKRGKGRLGHSATSLGARIDSVKALLEHGTPGLKRVTAQLARARFWSGWLEQHMPAELTARLSGVAEHNGTLVIFAESAAWSARLRFAVLELESAIRAEDAAIENIKVRVRPRG
jgi:Dna[CI] antecedent, DciA